MTNSTDNSEQNNKIKSKAKKQQGPIRTGAVVSTTVVAVLIYLYGVFFFDSNLRSGLSWVLGYVHGAEVNIDKIETSFFNGYFRLYGLQVTDKKEPQRNLVKVSYVNFDLLWDALLRAKFVVDAADVKGIEVYSDRARAGWVRPVEISKDGKGSAIAEVEQNVLQQAKDDYNSNILGDISSVMSGDSSQAEQLNTMKADLKSEKKAKELEEELKSKREAWEERFAALPKPEEIKAIATKIQNHTVDTKNIIQGAKDLQELNKLIKEGKQKVDQYSSASKDLKRDVKTFEAEIKNLEKLANEDLKSVQNRLKIPDVNTGEFTKKIFTRMIMEKLAGYKKYIDIGKQYMPPPKTQGAGSAEVVPRQRGEGKNIRFPITKKGYPLFWLKKAEISSKASKENIYSGNVEGIITNITSNPRFLGKPATIVVEGEFPGLEILGIESKIVIDNTTAKTRTTINSKVAKFPVQKQMFSNSKAVKFGYQKAYGTNLTIGEIRGEKLGISLKNTFNEVDYIAEAENKDLDIILKNTAKNMPHLTLNAKVGGTWSNIKLGLDSNLGRELGKGIKKQVQARIDQEKKKLEEQILGPYRKQKKKLEEQFSGIQNSINSKIDGQKQELDSAQKQAQNSLNSKQSGAKKQQEKKKDKLLKDLKKKFKL